MKAKGFKCQECGQAIKPPSQYHPLDCCISFKAGIKEVVDQVNKNGGVCLADREWQAKLKEWGVK